MPDPQEYSMETSTRVSGTGVLDLWGGEAGGGGTLSEGKPVNVAWQVESEIYPASSCLGPGDDHGVPDVASAASPPRKKLVESAKPPLGPTTATRNSELPLTGGSKKKRKRTNTPPRPHQRGGKKLRSMDLNFPEIPEATQALMGMVARLDQASTAGDVTKIVDAAGELLDYKEDGSTFPKEIKALLEQEEEWKEMAVRRDGRLKETVKRGLERYGIIPIGAVEVADGMGMASWATG